MLSHRQYITLTPAADCGILINGSTPWEGFKHSPLHQYLLFCSRNRHTRIQHFV